MTTFVPEDLLTKIQQYQTQSKEGKLFEGLGYIAAQRRAFEILETYVKAEDHKYKRNKEDCRVIFDCRQQLSPTINATIRLRWESSLGEEWNGVHPKDIGIDLDDEKE